jgi:hypothetical protein
VDQTLTQLPLGHWKFSFINIVSGGRWGGEGKRVIRKKEGDDGGREEMGEKKEGLRQRCGGLLKGQDTHETSYLLVFRTRFMF